MAGLQNGQVHVFMQLSQSNPINVNLGLIMFLKNKLSSSFKKLLLYGHKNIFVQCTCTCNIGVFILGTSCPKIGGEFSGANCPWSELSRYPKIHRNPSNVHKVMTICAK